jgi:hypothetical protein
MSSITYAESECAVDVVWKLAWMTEGSACGDIWDSFTEFAERISDKEYDDLSFPEKKWFKVKFWENLYGVRQQSWEKDGYTDDEYLQVIFTYEACQMPQNYMKMKIPKYTTIADFQQWLEQEARTLAEGVATGAWKKASCCIYGHGADAKDSKGEPIGEVIAVKDGVFETAYLACSGKFFPEEPSPDGEQDDEFGAELDSA